MPGRIGSSDIELHMPVTHAGGGTSAPQSEIENFSETLHNTAPRHSGSVDSLNSEIRPSSSEPVSPHLSAEPDTIIAEPKTKPDKTKSDMAKDFGDKFDKILKPLTVTLGAATQITSLISFIEAQEAKHKDASSSSANSTGVSGGASGADASGTTGQLPDLAPIPSQQMF